MALAKSLNEDKLSQLFVKVDRSTLDARLVSPHTHADLPEEARSLLVLKRGTGKETNEGLLFGVKVLVSAPLVRRHEACEGATAMLLRVGAGMCFAVLRLHPP
ncbi:MAG: hypothetical protein HC767_06400 [Akkermansiaceae bacterium]|nr:hypothetical protein [Akkermansiaceae bacterium]